MKEFLRKKNIIFSAKRYGIDALGAMAQGLFASLLIGTIISTLGEQLGIGILVTVGGYAKGATGAAMAISIGVALQCPPLVLFSLAAVGMAANELGGAGGPLAVLVVTIFAAEFGKLVSKETKIDIIVKPFVTICVGVLLSLGCAPAIGAAASTVGTAIMWATELQPFFMGIIVSVIVGIADASVGGSQILGFLTMFPIWSIEVPIPCAKRPPHLFSLKLITAKPTICAQQPATAAPPASPVSESAAQIAALLIGSVSAIPTITCDKTVDYTLKE